LQRRSVPLAMQTLEVFRTTVGGAALGMARRALDESLDRALTRRQFGRPIFEQQQIAAYLAEGATELDAARLLVFRAAWLRDGQAGRVGTEVAMGKLFSTEAAQRIVDRAVQIHGGLGVTRGSVVERLYREVRALRIYEGTSEISRRRVQVSHAKVKARLAPADSPARMMRCGSPPNRAACWTAN
jgi:acyl-CoA dehydrogenase